jgi:hypothetical protein
MKAPVPGSASNAAKQPAGGSPARGQAPAARTGGGGEARDAGAKPDRAPDRGAPRPERETARPAPVPAPARKQGLLDSLLSLFTDIGDPNRDKKRQLKLIERQLRSARQKFYNPRKGQVLPGLAVFFHSIYRVLAPAQKLIGRAESSNLLRTLLIESAFSEQQKKLCAGLQDEAIRERSHDASSGDFAAQIRDEVASFVQGFDSEKMRNVNSAYAHLMSLLDFVHFDFYFFLRKFDATLLEGSFSGHPRFEAIDAGYVADDLREVWDCILALDTTADWTPLLEVLRSYRDVEIVPRDAWKRILNALSQLKRSRLLELIIKHAEGEPNYRPHPAVHGERIVDAYLQKFRTQAELAAQKVVSDERGRRIDELARAVFGTQPAQRLRYYSERANAELRRKIMSGYAHTVPLNYLAAYLQDHFDKEMRPAVDLMLIRGKWATNVVSQHVSESLHSLLEYRDGLARLDQTLSDEGDFGTKIAVALRKIERDRSVAPEVRKMLQEVNGMAREIMVGVLQNLIGLGKNLKGLIDDRGKKPGEVILNWKELELEMAGLTETMVSAYKRLYHLVQLLQMFAKP